VVLITGEEPVPVDEIIHPDRFFALICRVAVAPKSLGKNVNVGKSLS
jgi:hypothetical protein